MGSKLYHRLTIFCATLCCTSLVSVGAIYEKAGFYAGLSAGAGYNAGNFRGDAVQVATGEVINTHGKISTCCFEKDFCGFIGYMTHLPRENWRAGIEFGFEKSYHKKHFETTLWDDTGGGADAEVCQYKIKSMYAAKLHAKVGKILNETWFVYGLVGVDMKKTEISMQQEILGKMKGKKSLWGVAVGLGIEREINENWRLGLECVNTYYPTRTVKGINKDMDVRYNSKVKTNSTQVSLRLIYNF